MLVGKRQATRRGNNGTCASPITVLVAAASPPHCASPAASPAATAASTPTSPPLSPPPRDASAHIGCPPSPPVAVPAPLASRSVPPAHSLPSPQWPCPCPCPRLSSPCGGLSPATNLRSPPEMALTNPRPKTKFLNKPALLRIDTCGASVLPTALTVVPVQGAGRTDPRTTHLF
ncbi:hypothetical protein HDU84_007459 [Entophlyctis sp. JEL0112]|nr:hypothetical protein HDU84_007459 [Entophlyctis sp. JEL0112]